MMYEVNIASMPYIGGNFLTLEEANIYALKWRIRGYRTSIRPMPRRYF